MVGLVSEIVMLATCCCFGKCCEEVYCNCPLGQFLERQRKYFTSLDADGDGFLSGKELEMFKRGLLASTKNLSEYEVNEIVRRGDVNGDGTLSWGEFITAMKFFNALDDRAS